VRIGWHPGVKVYVPPPPPPPVIREVIREVPAAAAPPPPPPNRPPTFNGPIQANPPILEPGQSTNLSAPATDPDGDSVTLTWNFGDGASATGAKVVDFAQYPGALPDTDTYIKLIDALVSRLAAALK